MAPRNEAPVVARKHSARQAERVPALGVITPPPIQVECSAFTGSLAMLFTCVHERKVDLLEIPLFPICEAYFLYLMGLSSQNLDEAAAALMALAYLIERKSWALLPTPEPEPEEEEEFAMLAPTAHEYQVAIEALRMWHEERERFFFRQADSGPDPYEVPFVMDDVTPADLARALERLLRKASPEPVRPLNKARRSISDQMVVVLRALSSEFRALEDMVPEPFTREDAVYWFLALLELIRLAQARVKLDGEDVLFARASAAT